MPTDAPDESLDQVLDDALDVDDDFEVYPDEEPMPSTLKRKARGGQMIGAAMIGLAEVFQPKPKVEVPITVEVSGDPPNIDTDGLDEPWGATGERMVAPPMDDIRARSTTKPAKRRR